MSEPFRSIIWPDKRHDEHYPNCHRMLNWWSFRCTCAELEALVVAERARWQASSRRGEDMKQLQIDAIIDLKNYGLEMGAHCQAVHGGRIAVHAGCADCLRLLKSTDDIWKRIYAEAA